MGAESSWVCFGGSFDRLDSIRYRACLVMMARMMS